MMGKPRAAKVMQKWYDKEYAWKIEAIGFVRGNVALERCLPHPPPRSPAGQYQTVFLHRNADLGGHDLSSHFFCNC